MYIFHFRFMAIKRPVFLFIITFFIACALNPFFVYGADSISEPASIIPKDFDFQINNSCSGHHYFLQFSVDDDGKILLVSRYTDILENKELTFKQCYVDIFEPDGTHIIEFSFYTKQDFVAELNGTDVILYFYDRMIRIDLNTNTLSGQMTSPDEAMENGTYNRLQRSKVTVGNRTYIAKPGFQGFTELICDSEEGKTILLTFDGIGYNWVYAVVFALAFGTLSISIRFRKRNQ